MLVNHKTAGFVGVLNGLVMKLRKYGLMPLSEIIDTDDPFDGIIYDDDEDVVNGICHRCPIINGMDGMSYTELFDDVNFEVIWNEADDGSVADFCVCAYDENIIYIIEEEGWYVE